MTERSDLEHLATAVDTAIDRLAEDRTANEERIQASVRKMRWLRYSGIVGTVLGVIAIPLAVAGIVAAIQANHAVDEMRAQRDQSRIVLCQRDNDTAIKINKVSGAVDKIVTFATPSNPNRTPEQQARVEEFVQQAKTALDGAKVTTRSCTPRAINAYYATTTTTSP